MGGEQFFAVYNLHSVDCGFYFTVLRFCLHVHSTHLYMCFGCAKICEINDSNDQQQCRLESILGVIDECNALLLL